MTFYPKLIKPTIIFLLLINILNGEWRQALKEQKSSGEPAPGSSRPRARPGPLQQDALEAQDLQEAHPAERGEEGQEALLQGVRRGRCGGSGGLRGRGGRQEGRVLQAAIREEGGR